MSKSLIVPVPSCRWPSCEVSAMSTSILAQSHPRVCDRTYGHAGNGSAPITDVILTINMNMLLSCLGAKSIRVLFLPVGKRAWRYRLRQQVVFCFSDAVRAQQSCGSSLPPYHRAWYICTKRSERTYRGLKFEDSVIKQKYAQAFKCDLFYFFLINHKSVFLTGN